MANKYKNSKGFLIIKMSLLEAQNDCEFGIRQTRFRNIIFCDNCTNKLDNTDYIYYIAALNSAVCKECCDDIINNINHNPEDYDYEIRHFNFYAKKVNIPCIESILECLSDDDAKDYLESNQADYEIHQD